MAATFPQVALTKGAWTLVAAGPLLLQNATAAYGKIAVRLFFNSAEPTNSDAGILVELASDEPLFVASNNNVYALPVTASAPVVLSYMPVTSETSTTNSNLTTVANTVAANGPGKGLQPSGLTAVSGTLSAAGSTPSFAPLSGRSFNISVFGMFSGTVELERQLDGVNWLPVTQAGAVRQWTAPFSESAIDAQTGALYRLTFTALSAGTANFLISQ
jgi:hypothetical protein